MENLFGDIPSLSAQEIFTTLLQTPQIKIERIVSFGQATAPGEWLSQDRHEWVIVLQGSAGVKFQGQKETLTLKPGGYLDIPAKTSHRVEWTDSQEQTVWLAVHYS